MGRRSPESAYVMEEVVLAVDQHTIGISIQRLREGASKEHKTKVLSTVPLRMRCPRTLPPRSPPPPPSPPLSIQRCPSPQGQNS